MGLETEKVAYFDEELPPGFEAGDGCSAQTDCAARVESEIFAAIGVANIDCSSGIEQVGQKYVPRDSLGSVEIHERWRRKHGVVVDDGAQG